MPRATNQSSRSPLRKAEPQCKFAIGQPLPQVHPPGRNTVFSWTRTRFPFHVRSAARSTRVNGSKCDRLGPPVRVGALSEERVDERATEFARLYQVATKLRDRLMPVIGPLGAAVIDRRLRGAFNFLETIGSEPRR